MHYHNILNKLESYGRFLKANLSWSPTWKKLCQIASLSVVLPQLNLKKLKAEYL